jgi:hypothetical protein
LKLDASHIGSLARIDEELQRHRVVFLVDLGNARDRGEVVALIAQAPGDVVLAGRHQLLRERLAFPDEDKAPQVLLGEHEVAGQIHLADREFLALRDVGGDVDRFLVRRHGHLRRIDTELQVAPVHVVGAEFLEVAGELFPRVLVVVGEERKPAGGLQLENVSEFVVAEDAVAHDVDVLDRGDGAFVDIDVDGHAIAWLGNHLGFDRRVVAPLGDVLPLQLQLHALERRALEHLSDGEARALEAVEQRLGFNRLVAVDVDLADARALGDHDHQHVAIAPDADVVEVASGKQAARRRPDCRGVGNIAHGDRHRGEHGARSDALQAFDPDVRDHEALINGAVAVGSALRKGAAGEQAVHDERAEERRCAQRHRQEPRGKPMSDYCCAHHYHVCRIAAQPAQAQAQAQAAMPLRLCAAESRRLKTVARGRCTARTPSNPSPAPARPGNPTSVRAREPVAARPARSRSTADAPRPERGWVAGSGRPG